MFVKLNSCLYHPSFVITSDEQTNYFQVGWMVAWIIDLSGHEHDRVWEKQCSIVRKNDFLIKQLINKGEYNEELLNEEFPDMEALATVLHQLLHQYHH